MIKFLCFIVLFAVISTGAIAAEFEVTGIIRQKQPAAIVNGKIVKVGDEIDGALVQKILDKAVWLKYKGKLLVKNLTGKRLPQNIEADADKKLHDGEPSKKSSNFFLFMLFLILAGAGGYFLIRRKKTSA